MRQIAREALAEWGIDIDVTTEASKLTVNQRHLVEIIRALLLGTRFIILDEPTAGLQAGDITLLFERIRNLQASGVSFIYISHHLQEVFELCHAVTVLRDGKIITSKNICDFSKVDMVSAMVGQRDTVSAERHRMASNHQENLIEAEKKPLLEIRDLSIEGLCEDVNMVIHSGECVGLAGHRGSGITAVADSIVGLMSYPKGAIYLNSRLLDPGRPDKAVQAGVGYVPEDRYTRGFVWCMDVADNITLPVLNQFGKLGLLSLSRQHRETGSLVDELGIKVASIRQQVCELSGGNQQKATLARALSSRPKLCVLVDPTAGVDIASKETILTKINNLRNHGTGILLVSDDEEDLRVCNRIVVMFQGRIVGELDSDWETRDLVMAMEGWARNSEDVCADRTTGEKDGK